MSSLAIVSDSQTSEKNPSLVAIETLDRDLHQHFQAQITVQPSLTRSLVSFQANKTRPVYRWYKYKEAFSASLVEYLLSTYSISRGGKLLDPFAGSGTALFAATEAGLDADGIELLPIAQQIVKTKKLLDAEFTACDLERLKVWSQQRLWQHVEERQTLLELKITQGAYPETTKAAIERYLAACERENPRVRAVLHFALLCILEAVSYTRKDGQYLRWDYRSQRGQGKKPFNKGEIPDFQRAICDKINEILEDLAPATQQMELFGTLARHARLHLYPGSCLEVMPSLSEAGYDAIITSPPYCNRYDYTRTYALELALLGIDTKALRQLRQTMLSCTVENRPKALLTLNPDWQAAVNAADEQPLLQAILNYLDDQKAKKQLNNTGIPRMVRGYFYEMACVIQECFRLLKPGAFLFMANDNVRYAGASISVDLILSNLAERLGFEVEKLLVLPSHKGNSSQQMRDGGRFPLRKCVYVWKKPSPPYGIKGYDTSRRTVV